MPSLLFPTGASPRLAGTGTFACPECAATRPCTRVVVGRVVRLFAVHVTVGSYGEYIECDDCLSTWRPEVLAFDSHEARAVIASEYQHALRRVLALLVITDGRVRDAEITTVQRIYEAVTGTRLRREEVLAEMEEVRLHPVTVASYLARVVGRLNERGKEQVLRGAAMVSGADGEVHRTEAGMIHRLGAVLKLDDARIAAVLRDFT
ncbi:MAG: TerB family tellurite resistance protein [Gemmatimonadota bacterium]